MSGKTRAAVYGRVSTDEQAEHGHSIDEQEELGVKRVTEADGWHLVDVFSDPGRSGATEDRPGLQAMLARLDEIDVVVVWALDRLARDVELFAKLAKRFTAANVRLESLTEHVDLTTAGGRLSAGVTSVVGQFEKDRIAERVRSALKARKMKGEHNGGPPPDGWMDVKVGVKKIKGKDLDVYERVHDPERAPVIRHLFDLAGQGMPDTALSRHLNAEGYRTRSGRPWDRRSVQSHLTNPWHAGGVVHRRGKPDEEVHWPEHDRQRLIDRATFNRIQERRGKRDRATDQHVKGRPAHRHLVAKLARCGACGAPMFAVTSSYRRTDGTRARRYVCRGYHTSDGTCDVKVDAEAVDTAVLENLPRLMPRFGEWVERIEDRHAAERKRLADDRDKARGEHERLTERLTRNQRSFLDLNPEDQKTALASIRIAEADVARSEVRVQATVDALASVPENVSHDRLLDFASALRAVIAGRLGGDHSVKELNLALSELFSSFTICPELPEGITREEVEDALRPGPLYVFPNLRREVFMGLLAEYEDDATPAPPMEWIEALAKSADSHE